MYLMPLYPLGIERAPHTGLSWLGQDIGLPGGSFNPNQVPLLLTTIAATPPLPPPAGVQPVSWWDRQILEGVPNKWLVGGVSVLVALGALMGRR